MYDEKTKTKISESFVPCPFVEGRLVGRDICNPNCQHFVKYHSEVKIVRKLFKNETVPTGNTLVECRHPRFLKFTDREILDPTPEGNKS